MEINEIQAALESMDPGGLGGRVLVVDDNNTTRFTHRALLAQRFDVLTASSGQEAIDICRKAIPDLILLDIEMPDLNGIETCRRLREWTDVPIIFATGHESLEEHMKAYDAGGNDIVVKPVQSGILLRKVGLAIRQHKAETQLSKEKDSLQQMAMGFLSTAGHNGALLNFMRGSVGCRSHHDLAQKLFDTASELGVNCSVMIRHEGGPTFITPHGDASDMERAILEQSASMGRIFQFHRRLVTNYDRVSIIVANMPEEADDPEQAGRIRDNIAILAETTEALCDNVDMRLESMQRAEQMQVALGSAVTAVESLREKYLLMLGDTRMLLQELVSKVEKRIGWLGATQAEEAELTGELDSSIQGVLGLLAEGGDFDQQFDQVIGALRGGNSQTMIELF